MCYFALIFIRKVDKPTACRSSRCSIALSSAEPPPLFLCKVANVCFATCVTKCGKYLFVRWTVAVWSVCNGRWLYWHQHCTAMFTSPQARLYFDLSLSTKSKVHFIGFSVLSPVLHPLFQHSSIKKTVLSVQTTGTQVLVPRSDLPSSIKLLTHHGRWRRKNVLWIEIYFCPEHWIPHCVSWKHYKGLHSECVIFHPHIRVLHKLLTNFMERDVLLNPQSGGPPLVGYLWLLTQYIRS